MGDVADSMNEIADKKIGEAAIRKMSLELIRRGVVPEDIGKLRRISLWQTVTKDAEGEAHKHDLYGFQLAPSWDDGPKWPVMEPGPVVKVTSRGLSKPERPTGASLTVVLPDIQVGYFRGEDGLVAIHDEQAIDSAIRLIKTARPDRVVMLGDNADFADLGSYRKSPAFQRTTQETIDYLTNLMARLRSATDADIEWLAGNHEERLPNWIIDNAKAAYGLRQGMQPKGWPVLSIPHLCRLDDQGVRYLPGYPASEVWLNDALRCIHGDRVRSKGSTAHAYLPEEQTSVIYGHIHRVEQAWTTRKTREGPVKIMAASPGCLSRTDGAVPAFGQGLDLDGRPLPSVENWQTGLAVVEVLDEHRFVYEQVHWDGDGLIWRGQQFKE